MRDRSRRRGFDKEYGVRLPPFEIDAQGLFDEAHLRILWRDEPAPTGPELDAIITRTWAQQLAESRRLGRHLFNGQLVRYLRHEHRNGSLLIEVGPTDYAAFMGTNYLNWRRGDELGWERFSNPVGTSATLITRDGWIIHGRRSGQVACHSGYVHSLGGGLEASERGPDGTIDAFASIRRELNEEAGIGPDEIAELRCLGLIRDPFVRQPELIFDAVLNLDRQEVVRRIEAMGDEHTGVEECRDAPGAIEDFIRTTSKIAPIAVGGLCLHGRRRFGDAWMAEVFERLPPPVPPTL